jgi:hypothetical protein
MKMKSQTLMIGELLGMIMYSVLTKEGFPISTCSSLDKAMATAKAFGQFVIIRGPDGMEFVGMFGVDSVKDGKCPDGVAYDWNKSSRIGATKR